MDFHQRGKEAFVAPHHVPQKDDVPLLQHGSLHSCNFNFVNYSMTLDSPAAKFSFSV